MPGAGKQEFPGNDGEDTLTKPGKAPQQHQQPGIPDIPTYLQDIGIIQVLPEQGAKQVHPGGEKEIGMNGNYRAGKWEPRGKAEEPCGGCNCSGAQGSPRVHLGPENPSGMAGGAGMSFPPHAGKACRSLIHLLLGQEEH